MKFVPGTSNYAYTKTGHKRYKQIAHPKSMDSKVALKKFREWRAEYEGQKGWPTVESFFKMLAKHIQKTESDPKERARLLKKMRGIEDHFDGGMKSNSNWMIRELRDTVHHNYELTLVKPIIVAINKAIASNKAKA